MNAFKSGSCDDGGVNGTVGAPAEPVVLRPVGVRVLAVATWVLLAFSLVVTAVDDLSSALRLLPFTALGALVVHALFWRPRLEVDGEGVTLTNVVRDVRIPFARLEDVRTRFALTLDTAQGSYTSWSSPAPGRTSSWGLTRKDAGGVQAMGTPIDQGLSASAAPNTDSGAAALLVRHRWDVWREQGGGAGAGPVTREWNLPVALGAVVLAALCLLAAVV